MESFVHSFIKAFGWSILHSFWQGAIIFALLFGVLYLVPKSSARQRHNLSFLSICLMLAWFVKTFISKWEVPLPEVLSGLSATGPESLPINGFMANAEAVFPVIISSYILGLLFQVFLITKGFLYLRKLRNTHLQIADPFWEHTLLRLCGQLDIRKDVSLKISPLVKSPLVVGYIKPMILFPVGFHTYLNTEQVEAILIHELTHIRRNDYLLNLVKTIIETILFFNPFVWLAGRFIQIERENACDDKVLAHIQRPLLYANALLTLETSGKNKTPDFALGARGKTQHLFHRIKRITNMKSNYLNVRQQIAAIFVAIAGLLSIAWLQPVKIQIHEKELEVINQLPEKAEPPHRPAKEMVALPVKSKDTIINPVKPKQKMKITVTDDNGNIKEYYSVDQLPDSLKINYEKFARAFRVMGDSFKFKFDFDNITNLQFDSDKLIKKFNSPEFKGKMDLVYKNLNSPEFKKNLDSVFYKIESPEFRLKMDKVFMSVDSPEFKAQIKSLMDNYEKSIGNNFQRFKFNGPDGKIFVDSVFFKGKGSVRYNNNLIYLFKEDAELKNNEEYKKLKEKFDKDVEKLREKEKARKSKKTKSN